MASIVDKSKDWWENKAPRERTLIKVLGATFVFCILAWVAMTVRGGLGAIESKNERSREALSALDIHRMLSANSQNSRPEITIPEQPITMDTYLDEIITGVGLDSASYPTPKEQNKGEYIEQSLRLSLQKLTIYQLKDLLQGIETKNRAVAITELHVKQSFGEDDKVDVDMTIVSYYKPKSQPQEADDDGEDS